MSSLLSSGTSSKAAWPRSQRRVPYFLALRISPRPAPGCFVLDFFGDLIHLALLKRSLLECFVFFSWQFVCIFDHLNDPTLGVSLRAKLLW